MFSSQLLIFVSQNFLTMETVSKLSCFNSSPASQCMEELPEQEYSRESQKALSLAIKPHGFNIGMNFGRCGGAGPPGHLHIHIVPRWDGDTNFMSVCSDTKVISQSLTELLELLKQVSKEHNLPKL